MRLIDADALIDGYKHMGYDPTEHPEESYMEGWCNGFNSATDHCMHHVIHALTIEPEPHWIPCSERLPEERQEILATTTDNAWGDVVIIRNYYKEMYKSVIAWMLLPEPYREGK